MNTDKIASEFDLAYATDIFYHSVFQSSALPLWSSINQLDESKLIEGLARKIKGYLQGTGNVAPATPIKVPHKNIQRDWLVPSTNDQIILTACVAKLSSSNGDSTNTGINYSYQTSNAWVGELHQSQLISWWQFQSATREKLLQSKFVLQLDIEKTFPSIDRDDFFAYWRKKGAESTAVNLLDRLLAAWGPPSGLPLVNDAVSYLGSEYLNKVDAVIANCSDNFIRFMDDYRIFGDSERQLEHIVERISEGLTNTEFRLNDSKTRLGESKCLLDYIAKNRGKQFSSASDNIESETDQPDLDLDPDLDATDPDYADAGQDPTPSHLAKLIRMSVAKPKRYMTVGVGRFVIGALHHLEINDVDSWQQFRHLFRRDLALRKLLLNRLRHYSSIPAESWRTLWLTRVFTALTAYHTKNEIQLLTQLMQRQDMSPSVRIWAGAALKGRKHHKGRDFLSNQFLIYPSEGRALYG